MNVAYHYTDKRYVQTCNLLSVRQSTDQTQSKINP